MLIYRRTSILESTAQTLVNTVNCVGVMGKGLAQEFKDRYPRMYEGYRRICDDDLLEPGKLWLWKSADHWVLNFPTKKHWRHPSKLEWIEAGLDKFCTEYAARGIRQISFPRLGCGNGNLDWDDVRPLMEAYLSKLPIEIFVHDHSVPIGIPEHLEIAGRAISAGSTERSFDGFMDRLRGLLNVVGDQLVDLETNEPMQATPVDGEQISICTASGGWELDSEDLRSVWLSVQEGLVTSAQVDQSVSVSGVPLLSIVALLPEFRPVEIQRHGASKPEIAVELAPLYRGARAATEDFTTPSFSWH